MISYRDILVVVRSVGERTTEACIALLEDIFGIEHVVSISETPFSKAVQKTLELGIQYNKQWVLCLDADVLVDKTGVAKLLSAANKVGDNVFQIQGLVLDKYYPIYRPAGNHLYRTRYALEAIECIPKEGTSLRPETDMLNAMSKRGFPWQQCDAVVGIHDYEQFYEDIYRKSFLQAHKHKNLITSVQKIWSEQYINDFDFQVAIWGMMSGKIYDNTVYVDKRFVADEIKQLFEIKNLQEKEKFNFSTVKQLNNYVFNVISNYDSAKYEILQTNMFGPTIWNKLIDLSQQKKDDRPLLKKIVHKFGSAFILIGYKIHHYTKK